MLDRLSEVTFSSFLHLSDNESSDLTGRVLLSSGFEPGITVRVLDDFERNIVEIGLDFCVREFSTDETLGGEEGVLHSLSRLSIM